jgi:hypothetical protein
MMDIFKKNYETLTILSGMAVLLVGCCIWINGKFNALEKDMAIIKTVLIMQDIMPKELAVNEGFEK